MKKLLALITIVCVFAIVLASCDTLEQLANGEISKDDIKEEIKQEILDMVFDYYADECEVDRDEITMESNPQEDLGSDSLMFVELIEMTAEKYDLDIKLQSIGKYMLKSPMDTMKDVVDMICKIYQYGNDIVNL